MATPERRSYLARLAPEVWHGRSLALPVIGGMIVEIEAVTDPVVMRASDLEIIEEPAGDGQWTPS